MTPEQVALVQSSFAGLAPIADKAAAMFFTRLFQLDPTLRFMLHGDMEELGQKLITIMRVGVNNLGRTDIIIPAVEALGANSGRFGIVDKDIDTGVAALLWALEKGLDEDLTTEARKAWLVVCRELASTMKEAAAQTRSRTQRRAVAALP